MKMECDIIRDLMPLYVEKMVSDKSKEAVDIHLQECDECRVIYEKMAEPEPQVQFSTDSAKSFQKYVKKKKWRFGWKVALISAIAAMLLLRFAMFVGAIILLMLDSAAAEIKTDVAVSHYNQYIGENADDDYRNKWGMDESIFPEEITSDMNVTDYEMVYYNPWDAQYLSYLAVEYDEEAYNLEVNRLQNCPLEEYIGYYGAEGFDEKYDLLAMSSDPHYGFVYALTDGKNQIIYVEIIFCNYFMDLNYEEYIDKVYLPLGFDASADNPYRQEMLNAH